MKRLLILAGLVLCSCQSNPSAEPLPPVEIADHAYLKVNDPLLNRCSISFPYTVESLPETKPIKDNVVFEGEDESWPKDIAYHGVYHGYDVYTNPRTNLGWLRIAQIQIGRFGFVANNSTLLYCYPVSENGYTVPQIETRPGPSLGDERCVSFASLYKDGVFSDNDLLDIYLQQIRYYVFEDHGGEKPTLFDAVKKRDGGYVINETFGFSFTLDYRHIYRQGNPKVDCDFNDDYADFLMPESLVNDLKASTATHVYDVVDVNGTYVTKQSYLLGDKPLYLGEIKGFSIYMPDANVIDDQGYRAFLGNLYFDTLSARPVYCYKGGCQYSLSYLYRLREMSIDDLSTVQSRVYSYLASTQKEESRAAYKETFQKARIDHYQTIENDWMG